MGGGWFGGVGEGAASKFGCVAVGFAFAGRGSAQQKSATTFATPAARDLAAVHLTSARQALTPSSFFETREAGRARGQSRK